MTVYQQLLLWLRMHAWVLLSVRARRLLPRGGRDGPSERGEGGKTSKSLVHRRLRSTVLNQFHGIEVNSVAPPGTLIECKQWIGGAVN